MARTHTAADLTTWLGSGVARWRKVEIQDADGTWVDWSERLVGAGGWGEERDTPVPTATVRLFRGQGESSLAPLMERSLENRDSTNAYAPAIDIGRGFRLSTAITTAGLRPAAADYTEQFKGRVDHVTWEQNPIVVTASGEGAWLMDTQIRAAAEYGSALGTAIETVLQNIVDATPSGKITPTIYTPTSPSYLVTTFTLEPAKVLEAAREVALRIGYDLRYRYDTAGVYRLTFMDPDRDRVTTDATFTGRQYYAIQQLDLDIEPIRNRGTWYYRGATGTQGSVTYENAASVADYGDRYFQIPEQEGIDTSTEAQTAIDAMGHDMSGPGAEQVVHMPYLPIAQLYDRYVFEANDEHYDTDQTLSVGGYHHAWDEAGNLSTTLVGTLRVVGAYEDWRRRIVTGEDTAPAPPSLEVFAAPGASTYSITYTGGGAPVELSIDGAAFSAAPASPITVTRPSAGSTSKSYTFRVVNDAQTVTNEVTIPAVDKDTVTPDLTVTPGAMADTTATFAVSASNPSGGSAPTITVTFRGTSGTIAGVAVAADTPTTASSGATVVANRPAFGTTAQASVTFTAALSGAGSETIQRTVQNQVKTTFGPTLEVTVTPGASTYSIAYTGSGTVDLSIDGGAYSAAPASPISVTRTSSDKTYMLKATADGQTITETVTVPALNGATTRFVDRVWVSAQNNINDQITVNWTAATNAQTGDTYDLHWQLGTSGSTTGNVSNVTSPYNHGPSGSGGHGLDLTNGGTLEDMFYTIHVKSSGGSIVGMSGQYSVQVDHA